MTHTEAYAIKIQKLIAQADRLAQNAPEHAAAARMTSDLLNSPCARASW